MFEHVGKEYYSAFFDKAPSLLTPRAIGVLHTIGKDVDTEIDPWVVKYIFPGGYLPDRGPDLRTSGLVPASC